MINDTIKEFWSGVSVLIKINYGQIGDQTGLFYTTNWVFYTSGNRFVRRTGMFGNLWFIHLSRRTTKIYLSDVSFHWYRTNVIVEAWFRQDIGLFRVRIRQDIGLLRVRFRQDISLFRVWFRQDICLFRVWFRQDIGLFRVWFRQDIAFFGVWFRQDIGLDRILVYSEISLNRIHFSSYLLFISRHHKQIVMCIHPFDATFKLFFSIDMFTFKIWKLLLVILFWL